MKEYERERERETSGVESFMEARTRIQNTVKTKQATDKTLKMKHELDVPNMCMNSSLATFRWR